MLQRIIIHNLALIRDLEIDFSPELNVLSGETGAGKSIIVDSLMLLIGARYDKSLLKYGEDKGFVEGVFTCSEISPLEELGIECDDGLVIVSRKFFKDGRNDIRVNGKQVTTAMLRELMQNFVDIYGQNEYQSLLKITEQRKILDGCVFKNDDEPLKRNRALYDEYKDVCAKMRSLGDEQARAQKIDILKYQIEEIENAHIEPDEEQKLVERRHILMSAERIKTALAESYDRLYGEGGATDGIADAIRAISYVGAFGDNYASLHERLRSVSIELDDIAESVKDELDGMDAGERELDGIIDRLDKIRAVKNKYGPYDKMLEFLRDAKKELDEAENGAELYDELCKKETDIKARLYESCKRLSELRRTGAREIERQILCELADLGMAKSKFEVVFTDLPQPDAFVKNVTPVGFDEFEFYLSPNAGMPLMPLAKIISGGEMSRFMLAIKLVAGNGGSIDTMIFDEIDTGISGDVGLSVAKKLCRLARGRQVLCVTHLAQIAAMADAHFYIDKYDDDKGTVTRVTELNRDGQIDEVSRLSGTRGVSGTSDKNAAELKAWCDAFKKELK